MDPTQAEILRRKAMFSPSKADDLIAPGPASGKLPRPALPAPTLEHPPGMNRAQRRAAMKGKRR